MQTIRAGCSKTEPKIFAPPQTPFPGAQDSQNLISWRWSLPSPTDLVWWRSMHALSSYRGNRPRTNTDKQTGSITVHCATKLSVQCKKCTASVWSSSALLGDLLAVSWSVECAILSLPSYPRYSWMCFFVQYCVLLGLSYCVIACVWPYAIYFIRPWHNIAYLCWTCHSIATNRPSVSNSLSPAQNSLQLAPFHFVCCTRRI